MPDTPARILVVDDSVVVRRMLSDLIAGDPELEVAGTAPNGSIALQKLTQHAVDLVVMDVEMPEMDGIEAAARIRESWPRLPVLMCSSLTARGGEATLRALAAGATDYVTKPSGGATAAFGTGLLDKIKCLVAQRRVPAPVVAAAPIPVTPVRRVRTRRPAVLAIGCSTGGPNALARIFADMPADIGVPILITQHMPPMFTRLLAERLTSNSAIPVVEAKAGDILEPGRGYVAPGDYHMTVRRDGVHLRIVLDQDPPENSCRPAVDVMFRSVANVFGSEVVAAVLTGMGRDGAVGARHIVGAGGWVVAQEAASCVIPSMPNAVIEIGAAGEVVELERMGTHLAFRCRPPTLVVEPRMTV